MLKTSQTTWSLNLAPKLTIAIKEGLGDVLRWVTSLDPLVHPCTQDPASLLSTANCTPLQGILVM